MSTVIRFESLYRGALKNYCFKVSYKRYCKNYALTTGTITPWIELYEWWRLNENAKLDGEVIFGFVMLQYAFNPLARYTVCWIKFYKRSKERATERYKEFLAKLELLLKWYFNFFRSTLEKHSFSALLCCYLSRSLWYLTESVRNCSWNENEREWIP